MNSKKSTFISKKALTLALGFSFLTLATKSDAQSWTRVYASSQTNSGTLSGASLSVGTNLTDFSSLTGALFSSASITYSFASAPGTNPMHVKIGKAAAALAVGSTITVTALDSSGTNVGSVSVGSTLGLLSGESQADVVVVPTSNAARLRITYSVLASLGGAVRVYASYFDAPSSVDTIYNKALDVLAGATGTVASSLSAVTDAPLAIDGNEATNATINKLASAINTNHLVALYSSLSESGDSVRLVLNNPGSLLTVDLLSSGVTVNTFNGNTSTSVFDDGTLLSLSLLPGETSKYVLTIPTEEQFDRVEVSTGGTLSTTYGLNVYEIGRKIPSVSLPTDTVKYLGDTIPVLSAVLPNDADTLVWFTNRTATGSPVYTGSSYTLPGVPATDQMYYAFVKRNGTIQLATVDSVYLQVNAVFVRPTAILEGPYRTATGKMVNTLATYTLIPTTFDGATRSNINTVTSDSNRVVDWVTIELRDTNSAHTLIARQPAILFANGKILSANLADSLTFQVRPRTYMVLVRHRNHLGAAVKRALSTTTSAIDYTSTSTTTTMQKSLDSKKMLHYGNVDGNTEINTSDYSSLISLLRTGIYIGYYNQDIDFNREVNATDYSKLLTKISLGCFINYSVL